MGRYRVDSIARLARQLAFAPIAVRIAQINHAEELLHLLEPSKAYPLEFVIFKITEYRPADAKHHTSTNNLEDLIPGLALQHDLGLLIEKTTEGLDMPAAAIAEPVLDIDDVWERFNVTSKTIQRWRK